MFRIKGVVLALWQVIHSSKQVVKSSAKRLVATPGAASNAAQRIRQLRLRVELVLGNSAGKTAAA